VQRGRDHDVGPSGCGSVTLTEQKTF
jgi:hypothetical protein